MIHINPHNAPRSWCNAVKGSYELDKPNIDTISVSELVNPPKMRLLTIRHYDEIEIDVLNEVDKVLGSATHYIVARGQDDTYITEKRIIAVVNGKAFTGQPDLYDKVNYIVEDYKTTSVWTYMLNPDDWERRTNCYAWLERSIAKRRVNAILLCLIFKDWKRSESFKYDDYPERKTLFYNPVLWRKDDQLAYISGRIDYHTKYEFSKDDDIPECTHDERWADDDIYAIYKLKSGVKAKRATNAQCTTERQAIAWIDEHCSEDNKYVIEYRPALDKRCMWYCDVNKFCHYWRERYG